VNITVFTSNQPRHIYLINSLATIADNVYAVQECNTIFPGETKDLIDSTESMKEYFSRVMKAEQDIFGPASFTRNNVSTLSLKRGDLNKCTENILRKSLCSDYYVVFGASYIKGWLIDFLVEHKAINIHMGLSPYYRGSACNFWALYDRRPNMVGASIILLNKGLDSGDILYHALPEAKETDGFRLGMEAVKSAIVSVVKVIGNEIIYEYPPIKQNRNKELRYSKGSEFTDSIAEEYLGSMMSKEEILAALTHRNCSLYYNP
jgi:folate-dependent phosphoribosylglycinamide formyltransferase PurN